MLFKIAKLVFALARYTVLVSAGCKASLASGQNILVLTQPQISQHQLVLSSVKHSLASADLSFQLVDTSDTGQRRALQQSRIQPDLILSIGTPASKSASQHHNDKAIMLLVAAIALALSVMLDTVTTRPIRNLMVATQTLAAQLVDLCRSYKVKEIQRLLAAIAPQTGVYS